MAPLSAIADRRNLFFRIVSGVVLGPLVLVLAFFGGPVFAVAVAAAAAVGLSEWFRLVTGKARYWPLVLLALPLVVYWAVDIRLALATLGVVTLVTYGFIYGQNRKPALTALGLPYVGLMMLSLPWLRDQESAGWQLVFFVFLVVWASDIGAFFVGRAFKGPKLAPKISPNKTWSGCFGGLFFSGLVAYGWTSTVIVASHPFQAIEIAIVLSLMAQAGDLFESAIKRLFNVKDSGDLIPGHGGMLDRIDALLWAAPAFALLHALGITASLLP